MQNFEAFEYDGGARFDTYQISFTDAQLNANFDTFAIDTFDDDETTVNVAMTSGLASFDLSGKALSGFSGNDKFVITGTSAAKRSGYCNPISQTPFAPPLPPVR